MQSPLKPHSENRKSDAETLVSRKICLFHQEVRYKETVMKVRELIKELKEQGLDVHDEYALESNPPYVALYYSEKMHGRKFLELVIPSDCGVKEKAKEAEFTRVKFHEETVLSPINLKNLSSGDEGPINRQVKIEELIKDNVVAVATMSYNKVKELYESK